MREWLKERIKKLFENTESTITTTILVLVFGGSTGLLAFSREALSLSLQLANTPMPLWAGISLALVCCSYIYVKLSKIPLVSSQKKEKSKVDFIENGQVKWKVNFRPNGSFSIDETPICTKHDMQLNHFRNGFCCFHINEDGCTAKISDNEYELKKRYIETLAEKKYRREYKISKPIIID